MRIHADPDPQPWKKYTVPVPVSDIFKSTYHFGRRDRLKATLLPQAEECILTQPTQLTHQ